jgi:hypothetical protein
MRTLSTIRIVAVAAAATMSLAIVKPAAAHDVHTFGPLTVALGWVHEPAYVGADNAVQVIVKQGDSPVTDITDKDLTVDVSLGSQKMGPMPMIPTADPDTGLGIPGEYEMHFIPTAPGNYTFHLSGTVKGTPVDETVTASDKTFNTVQDSTAAQWPNKVPSPAELATRVDKQAPRIDAVQASAKQGVNSADDSANHALVVGVIALIVALVAMFVVALGRQKTAT